jgi:Protein of unknown function (DUF3073)
MGRGRAKAKQTKVARELKYSSGGTDLDRLQQELAAERGSTYSTSTPTPATDDDEDDEETYEYDPD